MAGKKSAMARRKPTNSQHRAIPAVVPQEVDRSILVIRGQKVLLDSQIAAFYGVETRVLVQAVKRNSERFPDDFTFQLAADEWAALRSQLVILKAGRGQHRKYLPYVFTEQGVAMLSGVLRSPRAVEVNIQIMRAFVRLRQLLAVHKELAERLARLEDQMRTRDHAMDHQFRQVFALLDKLFNPPHQPPKRIGFHAGGEK